MLSLPKSWSVLAGVTGVVLIIGSGVLLHSDLTYPGLWALLPSMGAALAIASGHQTETKGASSVLAHPVLVWLGNRSYSWYLWHWPVLVLGFTLGMQNRPLEAAVLIVLPLALATLSYRWVELPFWKGRLSSSAPTRVIQLSVLSMLAVIAGTIHYQNHVPVREETPNTRIAKDARKDLPRIYADGCDALVANANVDPCVFGAKNAHKTAVLLGDSIGAQWFSLLPGIFPAPEWRVIVLTKGACPMVDEDYFYKRIGKIYTLCTDWRNAVLNHLTSLHPNIVFIGSDSTYRFTAPQWVNGSVRILDRLAELAEHVVVIPGTPKLSFDGPSCVVRNERMPHYTNTNTPNCQETITSTQYVDVTKLLASAVQRYENAKLLDLNDLVCPGGLCAAQKPDGLVVFRDNRHLTDTFVRKQIPNIIERLDALELASNL